VSQIDPVNIELTIQLRSEGMCAP